MKRTPAHVTILSFKGRKEIAHFGTNDPGVVAQIVGLVGLLDGRDLYRLTFRPTLRAKLSAIAGVELPVDSFVTFE